jgi:hypothetical protein
MEGAMTMTTGLASGGTSWTETRLFDRTFAAVGNPSQPRRRWRGLAFAAGAFVIVAAMLLARSLL